MLAPRRNDILPGTLDLLILQTVALEPLHGFAIAKRIEQVSSEALKIEHGSLYPALYRLEEQRLLKPEWGVSENNRKVKYYRLTRSGAKQLERELDDWRRLASGVERVIAAGRV